MPNKDNRDISPEVQPVVSENEAISYYNGNIIFDSIFNCGVYDYFNKEQIEDVIRDPIGNYDIMIKLSELVYNKSGVVSNSIDYCDALMTLDRIVTSDSKTQKSKNNKALMKQVLKKINDKSFIRDALFTEMLHGTAFYYFETTESSPDRKKYMNDWEVEGIHELNDMGLNADIISLPWQYTKIVGRKNGRFVIAFNLNYFNDFNGESLERKLKKYPKEIVNAYNARKNRNDSNNWYVIDSDKTMCRKIKCMDREPWGRSLIIAALIDVLYRDYWIDTKRNVLDDVNNQLIYETFPEGRDKGSSALTKQQQEKQHNTVKQAIQNKNNKGGKSFVSVSAGTKLDSIDISTDIFDSDYEKNLNNDIATDLGVSAALIGAMSTGTYSGNVNNLEMITAQLYMWVCEWATELNHVINANIIKDSRNKAEVYYFPTSFVNKKNFFEMMKTLYTDAAGSLTFLISASGVDPDVYMSVMDDEIESKIFDKYKPHQTSFTLSSGGNSSGENTGGRPTAENPTENTVRSNNQNGNALPSPSDNN